MSYQITITKQGSIIEIKTITAPDALAAIEAVEAGYKVHRAQMGDKLVAWSGYEFTARRVR